MSPSVSRRAACAGIALAALGLPLRAHAELHIDITRGKIEPLPIALPDFAGGDGQVGAADHAGAVGRSRTLRPVQADRSEGVRRQGRGDAHTAALRRLARHQRAGAGHRQRQRRGGRAPPGRVSPVGRVRRAAAHRPALHHDAAELAAHRAHHRRRDLQAHHRRGRLFRHAHRLYRRKRADEPPHQAARDHGPGRRQPSLPDRRALSGADAALLADDAGDHLSVLCRQQAAGLSLQHRHRPAGGAGRFPRHDLRAALLARRQAA